MSRELLSMVNYQQPGEKCGEDGVASKSSRTLEKIDSHERGGQDDEA